MTTTELLCKLHKESPEVCNIVEEYKFTPKQYEEILHIMDNLENKILSNNDDVSNADLETAIYDIFGGYVPAIEWGVDYHSCQEIARAFMEDKQYEEVYNTLYKRKN